MDSAIATLGVLVGLLGTAGETLCPEVPSDGGVVTLSAAGLAQVEEELVQAGPDRCGAPLLDWMQVESSPLALGTARAVVIRWGDPELLPPLYDLFAASMLEPRGARSDTALAAADAILGLSGDGADLLEPLRGGHHSQRWVQLARDRYLKEWGSAPAEAGVSPPAAADAWLADATTRFEACVASPDDAPGDIFDPLGLVAGPTPALAAGTRCASAAVLDSWRSGEDRGWADFVDGVVERFAAQGDFVDVAAALERRWGQGRPGESWQPETGPWVDPEPDGPPLVPLLLLLGLGLVVGWLTLERRGLVGRAARSRLLAVGLGLASIAALEGALALLDVPPGDELRPLVPVSPMPGRNASIEPDGRGMPVALPRPPGTVRVAVVGASSIVGLALAWDETIPAELADDLREDVPCVEVLNQGRMGYASPGVRALAVAAVDEMEADALVLYAGQNEVSDMREVHRYVDIDPDWLPLRAAITRTRLHGGLQRLLRPDPGRDDAVDRQRTPETPFDFAAHDPEFERRVTARFERELTDIARAARRRGVPVMLVLPSFNHHGLLATWSDVEARYHEGDTVKTASVDRLTDALLSGEGPRAVRIAEALEKAAPGDATPRCLGALARELAGDLEGAEAAVWECARLNPNASSVTPGVASAMVRVARRYDLPLADAHAALHRAAGGHLPGYDLHIDSVHLNPRGTRVVAREIGATIRRSGWAEQWRRRCDGEP